MAGVLLLHETLHEIKAKKKNGVVFFKVDFEKAYNNINWNFMLHVLKMKGFLEKFIGWVRQSVENGNVISKL